MLRFQSHVTQLRVIASVLCILAFNSRTQAKQLTLYEAVKKSVSYYPLIQQREAELGAAHSHIATVEGNRLPSLKLHDQVSLGTANSLVGTYFPMGIVVPTAGAIRPDNDYTLASGNIGLSYLEWEVYNFGAFKADKQQAVSNQSLKRSLLNNDKYAVEQYVISLYFNLLKDYESLRVEERNVKRTETVFNAISAIVGGGLKPGVDSTTARAEYAKARIGYLQMASKYAQSRISLAGYIGIDTSDIIPDTSILSKLQELEMQQATWNDSISDNHPRLDVYEIQYELQLADNKLIGKKFLPKIFVVGLASARGSSISSDNVYSSNLSDGLAYSRYNYAFGAAITYNLFDLKHRRDQLREGRYNADAKKFALENSRNALGITLEQMNEAYSNMLLQMDEFPRQINAARQAYEQQTALYNAGLNTLVDVTNALYILNQAESSYVIAQDSLLRLLSIRAGVNNQLDTFLEHFK